MSRGPNLPAPRRSQLRPTGRGALSILAAVVLLVGSDLTGLTQGRVIASALIAALLLGFLTILLAGIGMGLERTVRADAVAVGETVDVSLALSPRALLGRLPLGRGVVRSYLPGSLGGMGDLALAPDMPHALPVLRRGEHALGPCAVLVRDVLGLFHRRIVLEVPGTVIGLPVVEDLEAGLAGRLGTVLAGPGLSNRVAQGEPGPISRPYVLGDDMRRIHWRSTARTGRMMTREEEPAPARRATLILDTRAFPDASEEDVLAVQDRVIDHAASSLLALRSLGFDVTVVDADGDRILAAEHQRTGPLLPGVRAAVATSHSSLLALAGVGFGDSATGSPSNSGGDGAADLVLALGVLREAPFAGLDLDRLAGRAPRRIGVSIAPLPPEADAPREGRQGTDAWMHLEAGVEAPLAEILQAADPAVPASAMSSSAVSSSAVPSPPVTRGGRR